MRWGARGEVKARGCFLAGSRATPGSTRSAVSVRLPEIRATARRIPWHNPNTAPLDDLERQDPDNRGSVRSLDGDGHRDRERLLSVGIAGRIRESGGSPAGPFEKIYRPPQTVPRIGPIPPLSAATSRHARTARRAISAWQGSVRTYLGRAWSASRRSTS